MNALDSYWILYREPDDEVGVSYLGEFDTWDEAFSFRQATTPDEWADEIERPQDGKAMDFEVLAPKDVYVFGYDITVIHPKRN